MDEMTEAAGAMARAWKAAFEARDLDALTALYAPDTAFYGSTAAFYGTPAGVRTYFELLPPTYKGADFAPPKIVRLGPDAFAATGEVTFHRDDGEGATTALPFRIGWKEIRLTAPVFPGDTIYARSEVIGVRESRSRPGQGVVTTRTEGFKADGTVFMVFERSCLVPTAPPG